MEAVWNLRQDSPPPGDSGPHSGVTTGPAVKSALYDCLLNKKLHTQHANKSQVGEGGGAHPEEGRGGGSKLQINHL